PVPLEFPVRVLFITDSSQSMHVTDPQPLSCPGGVPVCFTRRGPAMESVLNAYPGGNGVEYALMQFASASNVLTQVPPTLMVDGFTPDSDMVKTKLPLFSVGAGETNYE